MSPMQPTKAEHEKSKIRDAQQKTKPRKAETLRREKLTGTWKPSLFFKCSVEEFDECRRKGEWDCERGKPMEGKEEKLLEKQREGFWEIAFQIERIGALVQIERGVRLHSTRQNIFQRWRVIIFLQQLIFFFSGRIQQLIWHKNKLLVPARPVKRMDQI